MTDRVNVRASDAKCLAHGSRGAGGQKTRVARKVFLSFSDPFSLRRSRVFGVVFLTVFTAVYKIILKLNTWSRSRAACISVFKDGTQMS